MKLRYIIATAVVAIAGNANAQLPAWIPDTITMANPGGTTFVNDVYYHLDTGIAKTEPNSNWHIAFAAGKLEGYSVFANHATGAAVNVYSLNLRAGGTTPKFGTDLTADTAGKKTKPLYNSIESYDIGAFNQNLGTGIADFGWGAYDMGTHYIKGDSIYLVMVGNTPYQLWIEEYVTFPVPSMGWKFHVANLDGSNSKTETVSVPTYSDRLFFYYDLATKTVVDREPNNKSWDIAFTRFMDDAAPGMKYGYTGILSNHQIGVAELWDIEADTAEYRNYPLDSAVNAIGRDWKKSTFVGQIYNMDTVTYFVKSTNLNIYELEITYATTGGGGAKIGFQKRLAWKYVAPPQPQSVNDVNTVQNELNVYPNPASNKVNLLLDMKGTNLDASLVITDLTGKLMMNKQLTLRSGLNALQTNVEQYPAGTYIVNIKTADWATTQKVVVQR